MGAGVGILRAQQGQMKKKSGRALPAQSRKSWHGQIHHWSRTLDVPISVGGDELIYLPGDMLGSLWAVKGYESIPSMHFAQG